MTPDARPHTVMVNVFRESRPLRQDHSVQITSISIPTAVVEFTIDHAAGLAMVTVYDINHRLIGDQGLPLEGNMVDALIALLSTPIEVEG